MKIFKAVYWSLPLWLFGVLVAVIMAQPAAGLAQEKKNVRMVFVSLAWNSEIPFRTALARGFFKQQGLQVEPILIRGGPAAIAALVSGEVEFAAIGGAQAVFRSKARGLDLAIIGCTSEAR
jgi:ABC-type nitrate/sulfonate/bicarbonate transport system substrate-binding protein